MSALPPRRREEVRHDLVVLRAESDRGRVRPEVVGVLVGAVIDDLAPSLGPEVTRSLREACPGGPGGPTCRT